MKNLMLLIASVLFSIFIASSKSYAQEAGNQVPIKVPITKSTPNALIYLPWDYDLTNKQYPLLCFFHGIGEAGTNLDVLRNQGLPLDIDQGKTPYSVNKNTGDTTRFIVLSIQAPQGGYNSPMPDDIISGINTLINDYHIRIDTNRMYPTGLSAGGRNSLWTIQDYPGIFPAAVSMSTPTSISPDKVDSFKNVSIWFFLGESDAAIYQNATSQTNNLINSKFPGHSRVTVYQGGHCCWPTYYAPTWRDPSGLNIYDWLLQYTRIHDDNTNPPAGIVTAAAGSDRSITLPKDSVILDGSASIGPITSWSWTKKSGPDANIQQNNSKASVTDLSEGAYVFTLTVKNADGVISTDEVSVTVNPAPDESPVIANAGPDRTITLPKDTIVLDGVASTGPIVSWSWVKKSGPGASIQQNGASASISGLVSGEYIFTLTVKNSAGTVSWDDISVTVNPSPDVLGGINNPVADAGEDLFITLPINKVTLDATAGTEAKNKPDGAYFYSWKVISGPSAGTFEKPGKGISDFSNLIAGVYVLELSFHINQGPVAKDTMSVTVYPDATAPGDVPFNANTQVKPYTEPFQYGTNMGSYGNNWNDTALASIALKAGIHTLRPTLPDDFIGHWGWDIRKSEFDYYTDHLGMKEMTLFVEKPRSSYAEPGTKIFKNLYEPIWDNGENGTPVNEDNYFALYIYNLVIRYGKHVRFWEIVNEPDMTGFWDNGNRTRSDNWWVNPPKGSELLNLKASFFSYVRMLRVAYEVIKKYSPDSYVTPGGIGYPAFLDALLRYTDNPDGGTVTSQYPLTGGAYFDVVSYHIYPAYSFKEWDGTIQGFRNLRFSDMGADAIIDLKGEFEEVLNDRGYNGVQYPQKHFILTETNLARKVFPDYYGGEEIQRNFMIKALVKSQINDIEQFYVYGTAESKNYNEATAPYELMGLYENLNRDKYGQEKLTGEGQAFKTTSRLLYNWKYDAARTSLLNLPENIDGAAFKQGSEYRYVLWARTTKDQSEEASARYTFPQSLNLSKLYRYSWNYSVDPGAKGEVDPSDIELTGAPVFLTESPIANEENIPPVANAGADQEITLPVNSVTLDGTKSSDPDGNIISYLWTMVSGPSQVTIQNQNSESPRVIGLVEGVYVFRIEVKDNNGASATATAKITVNPEGNESPVANAGRDQNITLPINSVILDGGLSRDPDGKISSFQWTQVSGPNAANIESKNSETTKISGLKEGNYTFHLEVKDNNGASAVDQVRVSVNAITNLSPVANAGNKQEITLPVNSISLDGSKSNDPDGSITSYQWSQVSGPNQATIEKNNSKTTNVTGLVEGNYTFRLEVKDNNGAASSANVTITVLHKDNQSPNANAGSDQNITLPENTVVLDGSKSKDTDGTIDSYKWSQVSGPNQAIIENQNAATASATGLVQGNYVFQLAVKDNEGAAAVATVRVTVSPRQNQVPSANAGNNQEITLPVNSVVLDGSKSDDPDGTIVSFIWTQVSGPNQATIKSPDSESTEISGLKAGEYTFNLQIKDNDGATASANVKMTVHPRANLSPNADAGSNQEITLPVNSVTLNGSNSSDPDGSIVSFSWIQTSGPNQADIENPGSGSTRVSGLIEGIYVFRLRIADNDGASVSANVTVRVNPEKNQAPSANAGEDQIITLPENSVSLNGEKSSDPDGSIVSYIWTQLSGPGQATIASPSSATTQINDLVAGSYVFQLRVTDNDGAISQARVRVSVNPATNQSPVADAGINQKITLPANSVILDGSKSNDPDGEIVAYRWTQVSGPNQAIIEVSDAVSTSVSGLAEGGYVFQLEVKDDKEASSTATVKITVHSSDNLTPTADAGKNKNITLPVNTVNLDGSESIDEDGSIVSYLWSQQFGPNQGVIESPGSSATAVSGLKEGVYLFQLEVKDNEGATSNAVVKITVHPRVNQSPVANAGRNLVITLPTNSVTLDGSASADPDGNIVSYLWTKESGPAQGTIADPDAQITTVSGLTQGVYQFQLMIEDNGGANAEALIKVTVNPKENQYPTADAGADQTITLPVNSVLLDGSLSNDSDGSIIAYTWTQVSGPEPATIVSTNSQSTDVSGLTTGSYVFRLTVKDNDDATSSATVMVTVMARSNQAPAANAGVDQAISLPKNTVFLDGSKSNDPDGNIVSYQWSQVSGPSSINFETASSVTTNVSGLVRGIYTFQLTVRDNDGAASTDRIRITVNPQINQAPVADAGRDQTITLPANSTTLDGSKSNDPDGNIVSYNWTQISGPSGTIIANPDQPATSVTGLVAGTYQFRLVVKDNEGSTSSAQVRIVVLPKPNQAPIADAGANQRITLPANKVTLDGTSSKDPDGTITSYKWTQINGPNQAVIQNQNSATTAVSSLAEGNYQFQLEVKDNDGAYSSATVKVIVNARSNQSPMADAGKNQEITLPANSVTLDGTESADPDGTIKSHLWTQISGPNQPVIQNKNSVTTVVSGLVAGKYQFQLEVEDNDGAYASVIVRVTVHPRPNEAPTANAGKDQTITLPTNSVTLDGSQSKDADGTIASYVWTRVSGPNRPIIERPNSQSTKVTALVEGTYIFQLEVKDNDGEYASATMRVKVNPRPNLAPIANAGQDQQITLQDNSVYLDGSQSSDPDGNIVSYQWSQVSGPIHAVFENPEAESSNAVNLMDGTYVFQLEVTDNDGATSKDEVTIVIEPFVNKAPAANAGEDQYITYFDSAHVVLNGTQSFDPDGLITGYNWELMSGPSEINIETPDKVITNVTGFKAGDYTFKLIVTDNYNVSSEALVRVHVEPNYNAQIEVYPNPVRGSTLNVKIIGQTNSKSLFRIIDVNGRVIKEIQNSEMLPEMTRTLNIAELHSGPYLIQLIEVGRIVGVRKFIRL